MGERGGSVYFINDMYYLRHIFVRMNGGEGGGGVYFINDMYYLQRIFVRRAAFQSECLNNFATRFCMAIVLVYQSTSKAMCFLPLVRCL